VRTLISIREPKCLYCGRAYRDEYRVTDHLAKPLARRPATP
jgi:hypothetical protein